jgi:hypothetical protein
MAKIMNYPILMSVLAFLVLWLAERMGSVARKKRDEMNEEEREDFGVILAATLTLLGLIIGFSFSMAISRYDQRKKLEEEEANAIGTEYLRADLLPIANAALVRELLKSYLDQRILFYEVRWKKDLVPVNARTAELQTELWNAVKEPAVAEHSAMEALTVMGMNDVLNSQGYTQAAWWNRIPIPAWGLMWVIAICCNGMIGYYVRPVKGHSVRLVVMPLVVAVSFLLIADIDSPRGGIIRVQPRNLESLAQSLRGQ